jgi:hypothetical protein
MINLTFRGKERKHRENRKYKTKRKSGMMEERKNSI